MQKGQITNVVRKGYLLDSLAPDQPTHQSNLIRELHFPLIGRCDANKNGQCSYQISLINMCASLGWYHMFLYNPQKQDVNSWVHTNYIAKKQRANGFSQDELDQLQEEIKVLETLVRKSVG